MILNVILSNDQATMQAFWNHKYFFFCDFCWKSICFFQDEFSVVASLIHSREINSDQF